MAEKYQLPPGQDHTWECSLVNGFRTIQVKARSWFYARQSGAVVLDAPFEQFTVNLIEKPIVSQKQKRDRKVQKKKKNLKSRVDKFSLKDRLSPQERAVRLQDGFQGVIYRNFPSLTEADMGLAVQVLSMTAAGLSIRLGVGEKEFLAAMTTYFNQASSLVKEAISQSGENN